MTSQTLNQRKSKSLLWHGGLGECPLCSGMNAIKKPDMQLYISGLIKQLLKQVMPVGGQNSWELGGVEMEFLRII